jgi:hypothetical protein
MIYNKLVIVILIILLFYLVKNRKERFNTNLNSVMSDKKYLNHFNKLDLKLRQCADLNQCVKKYNNCVIKFNKTENEMIIKMLKDLNDILGNNFKSIFRDIKFIKVEDYIENSLPHTRNKYIVLSEQWFNNLNSKYEASPNFIKYNTELRKLIYHEQFHIFQRYNPKLMEELYLKYWNLERLNVELPKKLLNINRTNPDALPENKNHWLFKIDENKYILPLCVYNSKMENGIRNTSNICIFVKKKNNKFVFEDLDNQIKNKILLNNNKEYTNFFGDVYVNGGNNYHPNELSASIFETVVEDKVKNRNTYNFPSYKQMLKFFNDKSL